jgi:hypothetical protein
MMKLLVILFFIVSVVLFLFFFGLAVLFKIVGSIAAALGRTVQEELSDDDTNIVDVQAEYQHSDEEMALMAAKSLATAFTSADKVKDLGTIMPLFIDTMRGVKNDKLKTDMAIYRNCMAEINSIIRYNPNFFAYTNELLAQTTCGFERIVSQKSNMASNFTAGMVYAADYVLTYMIKLNDLADLTGVIGDGALKEELSLAIDRLEKLNWATIVYPNHNKGNIRTLQEMATRLSERIQTYLQAKSFGVNNAESKDLYQALVLMAEDLNKALATMLDGVASWDLIQAGAELDAMRKELKLRGLY